MGVISEKETQVDEPLDVTLDESLNLTSALPSIYITHLFEDGHECKCITCHSKIIKTLKEKVIAEVKEENLATMEKEVRMKLLRTYTKRYAKTTLVEARQRAKIQAETTTRIEANKKVRLSMKKELRNEVLDSIREIERRVEWNATHKLHNDVQFNYLAESMRSPSPPFPKILLAPPTSIDSIESVFLASTT